MIQITPHMRILVSVEPVDFRKGIDGLAAICRRVLKADPFSGYFPPFSYGNDAGRKNTGSSFAVFILYFF